MAKVRPASRAKAVSETANASSQQAKVITTITRPISVKGWSEPTKALGTAVPESPIAEAGKKPTFTADSSATTGGPHDAVLADARLQSSQKTTAKVP